MQKFCTKLSGKKLQNLCQAPNLFLNIIYYNITQVSLERETGLINGDYSEDVLFLRQLIIDGQWDNALDFIGPLKDAPEFDHRAFCYLITKYKFFELLCIKQEPGPLNDNDFAVEVSFLAYFSIFRKIATECQKWLKFKFDLFFLFRKLTIRIYNCKILLI